MLKVVPAIALFFLTSAPGAEQSHKVERLGDVSSVYVAELGQTERAKALRQEIIRELNGSKRVRVVDTPEEADAVLSASVKGGSKNVDRAYQPFGNEPMKIGSEVVPTEEIVFRLDSHQSRSLWAVKLDAQKFSGKDDKKSARMLANKVSRDFLKAFEKAGKARR